jgi:hypothetical protein
LYTSSNPIITVVKPWAEHVTRVQNISGKYGSESNRLGDQDGDARITSVWIIQGEAVRDGGGWNWFRIAYNGGLHL